jgi:hypothetical protein
MLKDIAAGGKIDPGFRKLIGRYVKFAEHYRSSSLRSIEFASPYLEPRYIMGLEIIYNLYHQIFDRIDVTNGTFTATELNPTPEEIKAQLELTINRYDL